MRKTRLHKKFWCKSYRVIRKYIVENNVELPCLVHFFPRTPREGLNINPLDAVSNSNNKITMNHLFNELKIPHPRTFFIPDIEYARPSNQDITYIRKRIFSYGGAGKLLFDTFPQFDPYTHYVQEYYEHDRHIRHYWLGRPLTWAILRGGSGKVRNNQSGWVYKRLPERLPNKLRDGIISDCEKIQKRFGLTMFACDIAVNHDEYKFLEINSMPRIDGLWRTELFIRRLVELCENL